ncbi:hypothetical protein E4U54_005281, partial [Claviceps lovelessii]
MAGPVRQNLDFSQDIGLTVRSDDTAEQRSLATAEPAGRKTYYGAILVGQVRWNQGRQISMSPWMLMLAFSTFHSPISIFRLGST